MGIPVHRRFENAIEEVKYVNSNLMYVTLELGKETTHQHTKYNQTKRREREQLFDKLQEIVDRLPNNNKVFLMGDFNLKICNDIIPGIMPKFNEEIIKENGNMLLARAHTMNYELTICTSTTIINKNTHSLRQEVNTQPLTISSLTERWIPVKYLT